MGHPPHLHIDQANEDFHNPLLLWPDKFSRAPEVILYDFPQYPQTKTLWGISQIRTRADSEWDLDQVKMELITVGALLHLDFTNNKNGDYSFLPNTTENVWRYAAPIDNTDSDSQPVHKLPVNLDNLSPHQEWNTNQREGGDVSSTARINAEAKWKDNEYTLRLYAIDVFGRESVPYDRKVLLDNFFPFVMTGWIWHAEGAGSLERTNEGLEFTVETSKRNFYGGCTSLTEPVEFPIQFSEPMKDVTESNGYPMTGSDANWMVEIPASELPLPGQTATIELEIQGHDLAENGLIATNSNTTGEDILGQVKRTDSVIYIDEKECLTRCNLMAIIA